MSEIDPQAVFISDTGEIAVCPQYAGQVTIHRLKHPFAGPPWLALPEKIVETVLYDTIQVLPERAQQAILRLLQEREERDALLDECASVMYSLCSRGFPVLADPHLDALLDKLYRREQEQRWRQR
jgi:hypothetical protein